MWLVAWANPNNKGAAVNSYFGFEIFTQFANRFSDDKCIHKDDEGFFIIDGVLLNKKELLKNDCQSIAEYIKISAKNDDIYFSKLKGPFTGCFYDNERGCFEAFGNQTGDASLFFFYDQVQFAVSTDFNMLFDWCRKNNRQLSFNPIALNHLLTLGYLTEGNTIIKEITMLEPGEFIAFKDGELSTKTYHKFVFGKYSIVDINDAIEKVDACFRKAVALCFEKDIEYGYPKHLVDISGGLDSRMTNWVARDLGYGDIVNTCYAQSGSNEETFGQLVSEKLGNEFYFEPLDNVEFIYDIEHIVRMNYGLSVYAGITGGERLLSGLDFETYGLEHTGQLGDVILGYKENVLKSDGTLNTDAIAYSTIEKPVLKKADKFTNGEEFAFYYRYFHGTLATHYIRRNYTEAVSPFIDVDFAQLCFSISPELRSNHKLYWEWIRRKYPEALDIPSTRSKESIRMKVYHMIPSNVGRTIIRICKKIGLTGVVSDRKGMNPFDLWYANNEEMRNFINSYFDEHVQAFSQYSKEKRLLETVMAGERVMDKLLVNTVLAAYYIYIQRPFTKSVINDME